MKAVTKPRSQADVIRNRRIITDRIRELAKAFRLLGTKEKSTEVPLDKAATE
jgi:hypothetical protein